MKSQFMGALARPQRQRKAEARSLPAPIAGWVTEESLLNSRQASAQVMDNFLPTARGLSMRGGSRKHATISAAGAPVESMISYNGASSKKLFAATANNIYDVTTVANPDVAPAAVVSGQTSGYYAYSNFTTSGGQYLTVVNGTDPLLLYHPADGWKRITGSSSPAITGVSTSALSHAWVYRNRQFFIEGGSLRAHYLPIGSISGALGTVDLNGVFQNGGALVFGATWSVTAGDGLDDLCVFVTDQGEVAVYKGSDPSSASTWTQIGRYDITPPLGRRAALRVAGDLQILTEDGQVPMSAVVNKDPSAMMPAAVSAPISPDWRREAVARRSLPWEVVKFTRRGYAIVSLPVTSPGQDPIAFVVNTDTGQWCRFIGWDMRCQLLHNDQLFFGTSDGRVMLADIGGSDDGRPIYYTLVANPEYLGDRVGPKTIMQARGIFRGTTPYIAKISVSMDYKVALPSPPDTADDVQSSSWDAGKWDQATWDAATSLPSVSSRWVSIGRFGTAMQYQVQITGALTPFPDTEFLGLDLTFERSTSVTV